MIRVVIADDHAVVRQGLRTYLELQDDMEVVAEAERIEVRLEGAGGKLVLAVADDGRGFDADAPMLRSRRLGLTSMEERAAEVGGRLAVRSQPGEGTTVRLEVAA